MIVGDLDRCDCLSSRRFAQIRARASDSPRDCELWPPQLARSARMQSEQLQMTETEIEVTLNSAIDDLLDALRQERRPVETP